MLEYTGHPLVDVGVATILAFSGKRNLSKLTENDLEKMADFISEQYVINPLKSFLTVAFPNSGFTQPAFNKDPERRQEYARRVTRSFHVDLPVLDEQCVFTGDPATAIALSDKKGYPAGKAFRQHVPLLLGENQINFFPNGRSGLPISGKALLCIQAMPMGCAKCGGKLLAVHSDNPEITELFAGRFLEKNRRALSVAHQQNESKLPEAESSAKTLLIRTLLRAEDERYQAQEDHHPSSLTAYHFSNSGQSNALDVRNPPLGIYNLPLEIMDFISAIQHPEYKAEWEAVTRRAWQLARPKKGRINKEADQEENTYRRNFLYEDLFRLPQDAPWFIRCYFLRVPTRRSSKDDPRRSYSLRDEASLVSWKLTELFLEKVMRMNASRIQRIREMGDQLAAYVSDENDRKFFSTFYEQRRYDVIRNALIRVNHAQLKRGQPPVIKFDPFLEVFEDVDENGRSNWRLARDLVLLRMIERLYELKWIEHNADALSSTEDENSSNNSGSN